MRHRLRELPSSPNSTPSRVCSRLSPKSGLSAAGDQQAGDGNRTRSKSLEGFCATKTLPPHAFAQSYRRSSRTSPIQRRSPLGTAYSPAGAFRSSTGTSPPSSTNPGGGQGPNQLSRAPSSVTVDPLNAPPSGEARSATSQACSPGIPSRCTGTERDIPARTAAGYLTITSVSNVPTAIVETVTPAPAQRSASSRVSAP